ncbi:MAG: hypothetical protein ACKOBW_10935 [Planctomycetota bacterium]
MKRMILLTALAALALSTSSGCRLFGRHGDRCDPCSISQHDGGSLPMMNGSGTTILPTPAPTTTNHHVLPGPVEPTS